MSLNRYKPHIIVLPEDDANRQMVNGFIQALNVNARAIQVMPPAGGWSKVLNSFEKGYVPDMRSYLDRRLILLIDFDEQNIRYKDVKDGIPADLNDRVFILGVWSEPEQLRRKSGKSFEGIGSLLAQGCPNNRDELWEDDLLKHNDSEVERLVLSVASFLFTQQE